ncbi:hypothetical protein PWT90_06868 [Aphanocladium album]|nr:hypothetical protein PWT90_06868 [Aphanocladium album]
MLSPPAAAAWLAAAVGLASAANPDGGVVEIDLLFPRNETYAPNGMFPVVFDVQDPKNLTSDLHAYLSWRLTPIVNGTLTPGNSVPSGRFTLWPTTANTMYHWEQILSYTDKEGEWQFAWGVQTWAFASDTNTSHTDAQYIYFTTKTGAAAMDMKPSRCEDTQSLTLDVTSDESSMQKLSNATITTPKPDPCAAEMPKETSSSIAAAMTELACAARSSVVSCPSKKGSAASGYAIDRYIIAAGVAIVALARA